MPREFNHSILATRPGFQTDWTPEGRKKKKKLKECKCGCGKGLYRPETVKQGYTDACMKKQKERKHE